MCVNYLFTLYYSCCQSHTVAFRGKCKHPKIQANHASYQGRMPQAINTPSIFKLQLPMVPSSVIYAP